MKAVKFNLPVAPYDKFYIAVSTIANNITRFVSIFIFAAVVRIFDKNFGGFFGAIEITCTT